MSRGPAMGCVQLQSILCISQPVTAAELWKLPAAGPMGQCFPLPDDENVREAMQRHAENHEKIFNMYNFDVVPKPGSDMDKAQKLWDKKQVCCLSLDRSFAAQRQRTCIRDSCVKYMSQPAVR